MNQSHLYFFIRKLGRLKKIPLKIKPAYNIHIQNGKNIQRINIEQSSLNIFRYFNCAKAKICHK